MKPGQRVITTLRKMIATGELKTGERIAEIPTAALLGVSRMPVRTALRMLEHEGLVRRLGTRGYAASCPSLTQIEDAIEVRGVLEGLAAYRLAERGMDRNTEAAFADLLATGEALFFDGVLEDAMIERYGVYNLAFHNLLIRTADSVAIELAIMRNDHLPFASAAAMALDVNDPSVEFAHLLHAHRQHGAIIDLVRRGQARAAEALMRDHALTTMNNGKVFIR